MAGETAEVSRTIAAPVARVWSLLGDVTRMPEWSEDVAAVELLHGDGRSVGSRFRGNNKSGDRAWSMTCVIDAYEPDARFEFHTENDAGEIRTRWWYQLDAAGEETIVTEGFERIAKLGRLRAIAERKLLGDRTEYNTRNIEASLTRLANALE
jgi:uncharacterized protein YndB with AHSA1/START domain